jgi:hypothetical protein
VNLFLIKFIELVDFMSALTSLKSPGFCEWWVEGEHGPEYLNTLSAIVICLIVIHAVATHYHFRILDYMILANVFCNGIVSAVFHATLFDVAGSLDTLTMINAVVLLQCRTVQDYPLWVFPLTSLWVLTVTLNQYPGTGIDFAVLMGGHIFLLLCLLVYHCYLNRKDELNVFYARAIALFLCGALGWVLTEPFCEAHPIARYFFFLHSVFHITTALVVCTLVHLMAHRSYFD